MTIDLDAIKGRCEALDNRMGETTWVAEGPNKFGFFSVYDSNNNTIGYGIEEAQAFIAHARADIPALVAEVERLQRELTSEHNLMIMYSDRGAAIRRKLQEIGAIARNEEITNLDAIEGLGHELHDEQVRRDEWEKMYRRAISSCGGQRRAELEPAPDAPPRGHPREEAGND